MLSPRHQVNSFDFIYNDIQGNNCSGFYQSEIKLFDLLLAEQNNSMRRSLRFCQPEGQMFRQII